MKLLLPLSVIFFASLSASAQIMDTSVFSEAAQTAIQTDLEQRLGPIENIIYDSSLVSKVRNDGGGWIDSISTLASTTSEERGGMAVMLKAGGVMVCKNVIVSAQVTDKGTARTVAFQNCSF